MWENSGLVGQILVWEQSDLGCITALPEGIQQIRGQVTSYFCLSSQPFVWSLQTVNALKQSIAVCLHTETSDLHCGQTHTANIKVTYSISDCTHSCISSGFRKKTALCISC